MALSPKGAEAYAIAVPPSMTRTGLFDYGVVRIDWRNVERAMKHTFLFLAAASALTLAACQSAPPEAPPIAQPGPQPSAPIVPPQVVTTGPLTPAGVGRYMDALERDLRQRLRGSGIAVARRGDDLLLTFPNDKLFAGASLGSSGQGVLESVAQLLRTYGHAQVQVNGYTDTSGSPEQNLSVSQKRAALVGDALTQSGIAAGRIEAHGFGEANLKIATGDHVSEPRNRRIEVRIVARPG
jgi:outer membrane protein OmpA-like peptidoglycan-associated protein